MHTSLFKSCVARRDEVTLFVLQPDTDRNSVATLRLRDLLSLTSRTILSIYSGERGVAAGSIQKFVRCTFQRNLVDNGID